MTTSTRERLLDSAQQLFAHDGFDGTSVGDIEEHAGLTKRGGALYKHFPSKEAVLAAVIDRHAGSVAAAGSVSELLPLGDLRAELTLVARFTLAELDQEEEIHRILDRAGDRVPAARERMLTEVLEPAYRATSELVQRWIGERSTLEDPSTVTMLLIGGLVNLRRNRWTFGRVPLDIDDARAIAAWVETALGVIERFSDQPSRDQPSARP